MTKKHIARTVQSYILYTNHVNYLMVKIKLTYTLVFLYKNSIFLCRLHYMQLYVPIMFL